MWWAWHRVQVIIGAVVGVLFVLGIGGGLAFMYIKRTNEPQLASVEQRQMHDNAWSLPQSALMERAYGDRFQLVEGLSNETVPRWASGDRVRCDALFVDGAKHLEPRLEDLRNFRSITPVVRTYIDACGLI